MKQTASQLKKIFPRLRRQGKKIAFTNGCFDLLHYGHVRYLEKAKSANRVLIVGVNSDSSVRRIKGTGRPINDEKSRAAVLAALVSVDYVVIFHEDTPLDLIRSLVPDILIKGADWKGKKVVGAEVVQAVGGKIELVPYLSGFSTTSIIKAIDAKCKNNRTKAVSHD